MRKRYFIFLAAVLCLALGACSSKEEPFSVSGASSDFAVEFSTVDLEGDQVTGDIFSKADITVVNFWATYCGPCIDEMPKLAEWSEDMPDGAQMIGIVVDVEKEGSSEHDAALQIVQETGVEYPNLLPAGEFDGIIKQLVGVPTTYFVDTNGNIVGDPIIGADVEGYKQFVEEYLNEQK